MHIFLSGRKVEFLANKDTVLSYTKYRAISYWLLCRLFMSTITVNIVAK